MEEPGIFSKFYNRLWIVYSVVWFIFTIVLFIPVLPILILPWAGCLLFLDPKTRIHGLFILIGCVYYWFNLFLCYNVYGLPIWEYSFLAGWLIFVFPILTKGFTMGLMFNFHMYFPIVVLELGYWAYQTRSWKRDCIAITILIAFCGFGLAYRQSCASQYHTVYTLRGQNLTVEELFQQAGQPIYYREYDQRYGYYVKGEEMIAVAFYEDDTCFVSKTQSWFLD